MAGTVKAFNLPIDYVLYDMSYQNVIMYSACLPSYSAKRKDDKGAVKNDEHLDTRNPQDIDRINKILFG